MPSDATGGWPCLHAPCVSSRAHHPAHYSAHGNIQRRAYMRALAHVYMRNVAYARSTCTQPDRPIRTQRRDVTCVSEVSHMHTNVCVCARMLFCVSVCVHVCMCVCSNCVCVLCVRTCVHVCACVCLGVSFLHAHTCNTRTYTQLPTYTHTHMNTQRHAKECKSKEYAQKNMRSFRHIHKHTHAHTQSCTRTHKDTERET